MEQLRHLDRIGRGPLADLVAGEEQVDRGAVGAAEILAEVADEHVVLAAGEDGHGEPGVRRVVDQAKAGGTRQDVAGLGGSDGAANSTFTLSQWLRGTGTRTQVAVTGRFGSAKILRVSWISFRSSSQ